jgi:uncharacterized protein
MSRYVLFVFEVILILENFSVRLSESMFRIPLTFLRSSAHSNFHWRKMYCSLQIAEKRSIRFASTKFEASQMVIAHQKVPLKDRLESLDIFGGKDERKLLIEGYSDEGFLIDGLFVKGPQVLFSTIGIHLNVSRLDDLTVEHFEIFKKIHPPLNILIVGCGKEMRYLHPSIVTSLQAHNISVETMATWHALGTYNFLNQEDRRIAAILFPPID